VFVAAEKEQDSVYEVLFDEEFLGGLTIRFVVTTVVCVVCVAFSEISASNRRQTFPNDGK